MNKCKLVNKLGILQLIIKSQKGQQLNEREIYSINNNEVQGLLHINVVQKGNSFKLIYDITGFITFQEYLKTPLNKEAFARILSNVLDNLKSMQESYINQQYVLMDFNKVMVNPATQHIYFIYVPIQNVENSGSLREFLLNIIQFATFDPGEDSSYVKDYIGILNSGINFSTFELEEYIKKLFGKTDINLKSEKECPQCHIHVKGKINYCPACGAKISGITGNFGKGIYDPLKSASEQKEKEVKDDACVSKGNMPKSSTQGLSDGTTVLGADPGGTTVLGSNELEMPNFPYLIREKNQEKILVDKPSFRIGKEKKYTDYFVSDNNAVSRSHADIITREKRYYIIDLNSTNKTYIDGRAIPVEKEIEIFSDTKIRLANEDFVFYIES